MKKNKIDLSHLDKLTYSSIMRELNKQSPDSLIAFMKIYKKIFDSIVLNGEPNPADKTLPIAVLMFSRSFPIKFSKEQENNNADIVENSRPGSKLTGDAVNRTDLSSWAPFMDSSRGFAYNSEYDKTPPIDGTGPLAGSGAGFHLV